ncbi:MAG TPA: tetratricopeptide repeat protein [Terriglobales bacterium]|nr:tetratricopeptide repeat protein [Terriglobales bacterium]
MRGKNLFIAVAFFLTIGMVHCLAQTFEVSPSPKSAQSKGKKEKSEPANTNNTIGWGSGIETAREARAVDQALQKGDYKSAIASANRAAHSAPQNADLWFLLGYAARLGGDYNLSLQGYKRGLELKPSSIAGLSGEAQTYAKMGQTNQAQDLLKKVLAANPKSATDLQLSGELALDTDPNTALDLLKRADALQPNARTALLIARAYQKLNQPDGSKQYLEKALSRGPNDPNVLRAVGAYYRDTGKFDEAIAALQRAVQHDKDALGELGYTYSLAGKKKEAADTYTLAANRHPKDQALQLSAAQALVNVGSFEQASNFLKRAESSDPNNYRLHAIRAEMYSVEDHNDQAISEYQMAIQNAPEVPQEGPLYPVSLHLSLAEIYRRVDQDALAQKELASARDALNKVPGTDPATRPDYLRLRALVEEGFNDPASAERDLKEAMTLAPRNVNISLNYANLLWKIGREQDALALYKQSLQMDPNNHAALTALGYLSRDMKDPVDAEKYFLKLAELYPQDYVPYFALGDLYTSNRQYDRAQADYEKAHQLAPNNALVVAEGINSALESPGHSLPVAKTWVERAATNEAINNNPQVMRERMRYLTFTGNYQEAADLGYKVVEKLPNDAEAPDYLGYDLLFLNRFEDAGKIVARFEASRPHDRDLPLIAGYVNAHTGHPREAEEDFSRSLAIDPNDATAYMNRGFVRNDLREASKAIQDFEAALKIRSNYGEAHLGLAFANLQLNRSKPALREADLAAATLPDSAPIHLARAEAYRQQMIFRKAEVEYRAALKLAPNNPDVYLELAEALYRLHRYSDSLDVLRTGVRVTTSTTGVKTTDAMLYGAMARDYAQLRQKDNAYKAIADAEKRGEDVKVLMATGEALLIMGDNQGAMKRYSRALDAPGADRVEVRLALARLFAQAGHHGDAQDQVAFAMAESRVGEANAVTAENLVEAGQVLVSINQFDLGKKFFQRAQAEGADQESVYLGLANADLALGQTQSAMTLLRAVGNDPDASQDYEYMVALASAYQQEHDDTHALSMFARANDVMSGNDYTRATELRLAEQEGRQVTEQVNAAPELLFHPVFEDINIYQLDARIRGLAPDSTLLPPPRSTVETLGIAHYKLNFKGWPAITGLFEERNARGQVSFPNELLIQYRNTYDTSFSTGISPIVHLFGTAISLNPGVQFTIRRDSASPLEMNQDLFRQFLYVYTGAFGNWVSINGTAIREAGPFTELNLHSRDAAGTIEFQVGRPWAKTALLTGYEVRDILFRPLIREYYTTDSYVGVQRKFGSSWTAALLGEYLRSWRVQDNDYAIAEAIRPGFRLDYKPLVSHWAVHADGTWSKGQGFSAYNNVTNEVLVSYTKSLQRPLQDGIGEVPVTYPLRISFGIQQQSFYDFNGRNRNTFLPIIHFNVF